MSWDADLLDRMLDDGEGLGLRQTGGSRVRSAAWAAQVGEQVGERGDGAVGGCVDGGHGYTLTPGKSWRMRTRSAGVRSTA